MTSKFAKDSLLMSRLAIPQPHLILNANNGSGDENRLDAASVEKLLRIKLGELLGVSPETMDLTQPMTNYGVDSLVSVEFVNWASRILGVVVSQLDVLGGITTAAILEKAVSEIRT